MASGEGKPGAEKMSYVVIVAERGPLLGTADIQGAIGQSICQSLCCWEALHEQRLTDDMSCA